jgi:phosphohistidine phosphatase
MSLTLVITRHAKSDWHTGASSDHERPLNGRGLKEAAGLGRLLKENGYTPSIILSSDARRTEETALLMEPVFGDVEIQFIHSLYLGELKDIRHAVLTHCVNHRAVMVLGHNPGFSLAAALMTSKAVELKTACAAVLTSQQSDWEAAFLTKNFELSALIEAR